MPTRVVANGAQVLFRAPTIGLGTGFRVVSGGIFQARSEQVNCSPIE